MNHSEFLFYILNLLKKNKIEYWLMCGTLLGAVRDKKFLPGDHCDTDIGVKAEYCWKIRELLNKEHTKKNLQYDYIRRRELSVRDLEYKYKVDIFFMEKEKDNFYIYSYNPNPKTKRWDYEWRAIFPYKLFFPLENMAFLGQKVYIPKNASKVLEIHYGKDWKTPNPNWISNQPLNKDNNYSGFYPAGISPMQVKTKSKQYDFAYICVNLLRKKTTKKCFKSFKLQYPNAKIYVGDQDIPSGEMLQFYERNDIEYYFLPFDCGLSYARNFLIKKVKEDYIMWGDNDFIFDKNSNIYTSIELLKSNSQIGVVGGSVLKNNIMVHYERLLMFDKKRGILIYIPLELTNPKKYLFKQKPYYYCDLTFNYAIAKREVFDNNKIRWNENVKVRYEHSDFFLKLKLYSKYKIVYFSFMQVHHMHERDEVYQPFRNRIGDAKAFAKYWKLNMNFTVSINNREIYDKSLPKKLIQLKLPTICEPIEDTKTINTSIKKFDASNIINFLNLHSINFWLLKDSCYQVVINKTLKMETLYIGVSNKEIKDKMINFEFSHPIESIIESNRQTKDFGLNGIFFKVPLPVVRYLENYTGKKWKELQRKEKL